jgi:uncharacterized protein (TIGR00255 family)
MTGYGEASAHHDGTHYYVQIRTLNGKYFKATVRLQEEFEAFEAELESALRHRISRGTAAVRATCAEAGAGVAREINVPALDSYIAQLLRSEHVQTGAVRLDVGSVLALPGVVQPPADEGERAGRVRAIFLELLGRAADQLIEMRTREGRFVEADLRTQLRVIGEQLAVVRERAPGVIAEYEERLRTRMQQLVRDAGLSAQPADMLREVAGYAERTDIAEEISRLSGHLEQFASLLESADDRPVGRTLDFMAQEMLREANTMSSKSADVAITRAIVEIKGAIDRVKEQVQNVE